MKKKKKKVKKQIKNDIELLNNGSLDDAINKIVGLNEFRKQWINKKLKMI